MGGDAEKEVLAILEQALKREIDSEVLYRRGAHLSERENVKEIFNKLADEEKKHTAIVRDLYRDAKKRLGLKILNDEDEDS